MQKKNILLCVSGGIAVYKAVNLTSKLTQANFNVKVIMTASARQFVNPLSFQVMSKNDVYFDTFDEKDSSVIAHIDLADWADLVLVAPTTANVIGKMANGIADDMLTTTLLATTAPVWIAPAMNVHMYDHPAVIRNIEILHQDGYRFIEPSEGYLACGYVGKGRLEEPEKIAELALAYFQGQPKQLQGKKIVITAGVTQEKLKQLNLKLSSTASVPTFSTTLAQVAVGLGAEVTLLAANLHSEIPQGVRLIQVETASELIKALTVENEQSHVVIHTANVNEYKITKEMDTETEFNVSVEPVDLLATLEKATDDQIFLSYEEDQEKVIFPQSVQLDYVLTNSALRHSKGESIRLGQTSEIERAKAVFNILFGSENNL